MFAVKVWFYSWKNGEPVTAEFNSTMKDLTAKLKEETEKRFGDFGDLFYDMISYVEIKNL